jgi:hypothetical protein
MKLKLEWARPVSLKDGSDENLIYTCDHNKLPKKAGIYVFGRRYGTKIEALYVGRAESIQGRLRGQFKNLPLMLHIQKAKAGKRVLLIGRFMPKPGQKMEKCLGLLERALIRHFLSEGHDLVNIQGATLRRHEITSLGAKRAVPEQRSFSSPPPILA